MSVGFGEDLALNPKDSCFIDPEHDDFQIFPAQLGAIDVKDFPEIITAPGIPKVDLTDTLHGEQITEFHNPIKLKCK